MTHLRARESEAVHVMREVASELERPVLLFSGDKDSLVLLRLAEKAFRPGRFLLPFLHIDTGHNFPEALDFRDRRIAELGERLLVAKVQDSIDAGRVMDETGRPLTPRTMYPMCTIKHTTRVTRAMLIDLQYRLDVNTLHRDEQVTSLGLNDIGRIRLRATTPLLYDPYQRNRTTGSHPRGRGDEQQRRRRHAFRSVGAGMLIAPPLRCLQQSVQHLSLTVRAGRVAGLSTLKELHLV